MKLVRQLVTGLFSAGQVAGDALSSARELLGLIPSVPSLGIAACCASTVEAEIYQQNIGEVWTRFPLLVCKRRVQILLLDQSLETYLIGALGASQREKKLQIELACLVRRLLEEGSVQQLAGESAGDLAGWEELSVCEGAQSFLDWEEYDLSWVFERIQRLKVFVSQLSPPAHFRTELEALEKSCVKLQEKKEIIESRFLRSYAANQILFKEATASGEAARAEEAKEQLAILQGTLGYMVLDRVDCSEFCPNKSHEEDVDVSSKLLAKLRVETSSAGRKLWFLRLGMLFSLACAVATGVVSFYTFPGVVVGMVSTVFHCALSGVALSAIIWPLTIIVAIAYGMLIYNTIADLVIHDTMSRWWRKLSKETAQHCEKMYGLRYYSLMIRNAVLCLFSKLIAWFIPRAEERWYAYLLRIVLGLAVVAFGVLSSLATGYTVFFQLQGFVGLAVCVITALPICLGDLLFTLKNSYDSLMLLCEMSSERLRTIFSPLYMLILRQMQCESIFQCVLWVVRLPLLIVLILSKVLVFLAHVIFTAASADKFFNWPSFLTVAIAAGSEFLTDIFPLFGQKSEAEHEHGGVLNWIIRLLLFIPVTLLGVLNWVLSQFNRFMAGYECLTLGKAVFQEWELFGIWHKHAESHQGITIDLDQTKLPLRTTYQGAMLMCNKQIDRLQSGPIMTQAKQAKIQVFREYAKEFSQLAENCSGSEAGERGTSAPVREEKQEDLEKLAVHRYRCSTFFGSSKPTESVRRYREIIKIVNNRGMVTRGSLVVAMA